MTETEQNARTWPPRWAITVIGVILLIGSILGICVSPFAVMASPFLFDAPGSDKNAIVYMLLGGMLALPLVSILTGIASWRAIRRHSPLALAIAGTFGLGWIAYMIALVVALDVQCGGQFSCMPPAG